MSPAHSALIHQQQYASTGQLSESLPSSQVNLLSMHNGSAFLTFDSLSLSINSHHNKLHEDMRYFFYCDN